jgi:hypothetical protein
MAEALRTEIDPSTGRRYNVYPNGLTKWADNGRIRDGALWKGRGSELARVRKEHQREKVRAEILRTTQDANLPDVPKPSTSAEAFAVGAGLVWEATVLNPDAHERDRIDGLQSIAEIGDFIPNRQEAAAISVEQMNIQNNVYSGLPGFSELIAQDMLDNPGKTEEESRRDVLRTYLEATKVVMHERGILPPDGYKSPAVQVIDYRDKENEIVDGTIRDAE